MAFFDLMQEPNYEDYEIEYWSGNRWGFLGNGFDTCEFDGKSDLTYYLDVPLSKFSYDEGAKDRVAEWHSTSKEREEMQRQLILEMARSSEL